jgi:dTDP-4-dehydrorhamnose 3,5-epimerase
MNEIPGIIQGGSYKDERGTLGFFNDFDLLPVRRFYVIEHTDMSVIRAWQAHKIEQKWFYAIAGSFKIVIVKPEGWPGAPEKLFPQEFILKSGDKQLLHVPGGFANGFKALQPGSQLMVFSDSPISKAGSDDFRFDKSLWYDWENM